MSNAQEELETAYYEFSIFLHSKGLTMDDLETIRHYLAIIKFHKKTIQLERSLNKLSSMVEKYRDQHK